MKYANDKSAYETILLNSTQGLQKMAEKPEISLDFKKIKNNFTKLTLCNLRKKRALMGSISATTEISREEFPATLYQITEVTSTKNIFHRNFLLQHVLIGGCLDRKQVNVKPLG